MKNKNNIPKKERPGKTVTAIELGEETIAVYETSFFKRGPSSRLVTAPIGTKTPEGIAGEIAEIFRANDITHKKAFLIIPRHLVMVKTLRLPSVNEDEISRMTALESAKEMPYADGGVITGHRIIERRPDGYSGVLTVMAQAEPIRRYIDIMNKAGISVEKIALSTEALFVWYLHLKGASPAANEEPVMLIGIGGEYADIAIIEGKKLLFTRAFSYVKASGPADRRPGGASGDLKTKIADNVKLALMLNQKERAVSPDRIVITGPEDLAREAAVNLKSLTDLRYEIVPQAAPAPAGLSLAGEAVKINLLPGDVIAANETRAIKRYAARSAILALSAALVLFLASAKISYDKSGYLRSLDARIAAIAPDVRAAKAVLDNIKIMKQDSGIPFVTEMLDEIYAITPPEIKFSVLDCQPNGSFTFRASAGSLDDTVKFMRVLEASKYFRNAKLQYTSRRQEGAGQVVDFEITCVVVKGPDVR